MNRRVAIIGGGLGGLATAVRLAARGHRVTLCEAGPRLGGKMNFLERDGFRFDTGPSLITMPWVFEETFEAAGLRMSEHVELKRLEPVARYIWPDGATLLHSTCLPQWLETVRELEPRDVDGFLRFLELGSRLFELSNETFLRRPVTEPPDWRSLKALRHMPLRHGWGNYAATVQHMIRSPHLRQMLLRYPTYVGSSPYRSPATLAVIPYMEHAFGGWYVSGGLYRIVQALADAAKAHGAELLTNAAVECIDHSRGSIKGLQLSDGRRFQADIVVMNGDASMLNGLLGGKGGGMTAKERSMSGLISLAAVRRDLPGLHHHTVFFSADYRREFEQLIDQRAFPDDPTVYVNAPSRSDRSLVPGAGETLFIMANAPADANAWSTDDTERATQRVHQRLLSSGMEDFRDEVASLETWTPARIGAAYRMPGGAIYGRNSHGWRNAFLRPRNKQRMKGLYLVGGSSHPGGGTPTVLLSAKITANLIEKHERA